MNVCLRRTVLQMKKSTKTLANVKLALALDVRRKNKAGVSGRT